MNDETNLKYIKCAYWRELYSVYTCWFVLNVDESRLRAPKLHEFVSTIAKIRLYLLIILLFKVKRQEIIITMT